jgi:tripartite-type tricarboxylate transporter receptor subunit TctC
VVNTSPNILSQRAKFANSSQSSVEIKGTPKDVVVKLNAAVVDALAYPTVRQQLADLGQEVPPRDQQTPEALGAFQRAEMEKWWPIIKTAGIKAE